MPTKTFMPKWDSKPMYALHMNTQALLAVMGNLWDAWNEHSGRDQALMRKESACAVLVPGECWQCWVCSSADEGEVGAE